METTYTSTLTESISSYTFNNNQIELEIKYKHLQQENQHLQAEYTKVQTENIVLTERIQELEQQIKKLESSLKKDSHNSSKPPSTDLFKKPKPKNSRTKTNRKVGGQKGHKGNTLEKVDNPDYYQIHKTAHACRKCGKNLNSTPVAEYEERQEFDIPPVKIEVTAHKAEIKICDCGCRNIAKFPKRITAPVQYGLNLKAFVISLNNEGFVSCERTSQLLEGFTQSSISQGSIINFNKELSIQLEPFEQAITTRLKNEEVLHHDESGMKINGKNHWLHISCTGKYTHYAIDPKRGKEAMDRIGILPDFTGILTHDHFKSYYKYTQCTHSLCNAHHARELTYLFEEEGSIWARRMYVLLMEAKSIVDQAKASKLKSLDTNQIESIESQYRQIISLGYKGLPEPEKKPKGKRGRTKKTKEHNLLNRLNEYEQDTLRFVKDFRVSFDNNQAERDVRMAKVKKKVSGCFRSNQGAKDFARIRSYISTVKKHGKNAFEEIKNAIAGNPFIPIQPEDTS